MSPRRRGDWNAEALAWARAGMSAADAAERWGVSYTCAYERLRAELARAGERPRSRVAPDPEPEREPDYSHTDAYVQGFEAGQAISARFSALEASLSARIAELEASLAKSAVVEQPHDAARQRNPTTKAPAALWAWIVCECQRQLGDSGVCAALGIELNEFYALERGTKTPNAKQQDELRRLLATIWGREFFVDHDELEDERERVVSLASRLSPHRRAS